MRRYIAALCIGVLLCSCKNKEVTKAKVSELIGPIGSGLSPLCTKENDGKRFAFEGYLQLPSSTTIDDKGKVALDLFAALDGDGLGKGRSASVEAKNGDDVDDLWSAVKKTKSAGYKTQKGEIAKDALAIHTKNGLAHAEDKIRLVVELEAITQFQTKAITACVAHFVEAEKL